LNSVEQAVRDHALNVGGAYFDDMTSKTTLSSIS
jgi:hypothetical protein